MSYQLWNPVAWDAAYKANFYTPTEPYMRKPVTITHMHLAEDAEERVRAEGYVTLPELDEKVIQDWAESDANLLMALVLEHLAS